MKESFPSPVSIRTTVPLTLGNDASCDVVSFNGLHDRKEHIALRFGGASGQPSIAPLVRLHSECLTGDVFGSSRCDCGCQLQDSIETLSREGGVLLYLRQEGRGIGLYNKLDAYRLQMEQGLDTYQANEALHLPADARDYRVAADMLKAFGIREIRLLSGNPDKAAQLRRYGIKVTAILPTPRFPTNDNAGYLKTKQVIGGHVFQPGASL